MKGMIGYCGLDCEHCDAYLATMHNDQALREKTAKLWAELNNAPILPEHINCEGCRGDGTKQCSVKVYVQFESVQCKKGFPTVVAALILPSVRLYRHSPSRIRPL